MLRAKMICPHCGSLNSLQLLVDEMYNLEPIVVDSEVKLIKYPLRRMRVYRCRSCGEVFSYEPPEKYIGYIDTKQNNKVLFLPSDLYNKLSESAKNNLLKKFQKIESIGGVENENIES